MSLLGEGCSQCNVRPVLLKKCMKLRSCLQSLCGGRAGEVPYEKLGKDILCPFRVEGQLW